MSAQLSLEASGTLFRSVRHPISLSLAPYFAPYFAPCRHLFRKPVLTFARLFVGGLDSRLKLFGRFLPAAVLSDEAFLVSTKVLTHVSQGINSAFTLFEV